MNRIETVKELVLTKQSQLVYLRVDEVDGGYSLSYGSQPLEKFKSYTAAIIALEIMVEELQAAGYHVVVDLQ
jgi:hypothetical protein